MSATGATAGRRGPMFWGALSALVAAPVAAIALSAVNLLQAADLDGLAAGQEQTVAQLERRVAALGDRAAPPVDMSAIYLPGATPALAKAGLQRLLVDAVERASGRVIETQDAADGDQAQETADAKVRLRLTFDTRNAALIDLLHEIETGLPLLTVERIEIRRLDAGADGDPEDPALRVGLVVVGAARFVTG